MAKNTTSDPSPPTTSLRVVNDDVLTPAAVGSLYQGFYYHPRVDSSNSKLLAYTADLAHFHYICPDVKPTRRYQWLFEHVINRTQQLYAERAAVTAGIATKALKDLEVLIKERKRVEAGYAAELEAKDEVIEGLIKQLQGALGERFKETDMVKMEMETNRAAGLPKGPLSKATKGI
jgi:hypothetical protein